MTENTQKPVRESDPEAVTDVQPKNKALDDLLREAVEADSAGDTERQEAEQRNQQRETDTIEADLRDTLSMLATVAQPGMWWLTEPEFERLWGPKVQAGIASSGAEIMRRHGLSLGGLMSQYGPYIALGGALGPSALATVNAYKREKAKAIEQNKAGNHAAST